MNSMIALRSFLTAVLLAAPLPAQDPVAYWDFENGLTSVVNNAQFQGTAQGFGTSITTTAKVGQRALQIDDSPGASNLYTLIVNSAMSNYTFSGTSSFGTIVGVPNNRFQVGGNVSMLLNPGSGPFTTGTFSGGSMHTIPSTVMAQIPNPIPILPPLATISIAGAVFRVTSPSFNIQPNGSFTTQVTFSATAGTVNIVPLIGSPSMINLASAGPSSPTMVSGTVNIQTGTVTLNSPLNGTFVFDDGMGNTATITITGTVVATAPRNFGPPTYLDVTSPVIQAGQGAFTIVAWYRFEDFSQNGSRSSNAVWETTNTLTGRGASGLSLVNNRASTQWTIDDVAGGVFTGNNGTPDNGMWHHVAVAWNKGSATIKFYFDGQLVATVPTSGADIEPSDGFHIGGNRFGDATSQWDGQIDDVAVFDRELSAAFVAGLSAGTYHVMARPYGSGCHGAAIGSSNVPILGSNNFAVTLSGATPMRSASLIFGTSNSMHLGVPLPFDLTAFNAPGCSLLASIFLTFGSGTNAGGNASVGIPIPTGNFLAGLHFYFQWVILDPGINGMNLAWSDGLETTLIRN